MPADPLTPERENAIRSDLAAVPAPPWRWIGSRGAGGPQLVTDHSGRQYLLRAIKPVDGRGDELLDPAGDYPIYGDLEFRDQRDGEEYSRMRNGNELGIGRTSYDPDSLVGVDNAVANWLMKSAAHAADLLAELDRVRAERDELKAITVNARQLSGHWLKQSGTHFSTSNFDAMQKYPYAAGAAEGRANQHSHCANELRDVLDGETADTVTDKDTPCNCATEVTA